MQLLISSSAIFAVAVIYCVWRSYAEALRRRHRTLRQRVTYMLWVAADQMEEEAPAELALLGGGYALPDADGEEDHWLN